MMHHAYTEIHAMLDISNHTVLHLYASIVAPCVVWVRLMLLAHVM